MTNSINRRTMLSGVTVLALPVSAIASQRKSSEGLILAIDRLHQLDVQVERDGKAATALELLAKANMPPLPPELLQPIDLVQRDDGQRMTLPNVTRKPNNPTHGWSTEELENFLQSGKFEFLAKLDPKTDNEFADCDTVITFKSVKMANETLAHIARLLDLRKAHEATETLHYAAHERANSEWEDLLDVQDEAMQALIEHPVSSIAELATKSKTILSHIMVRDIHEWQSAACETLCADIQALAAI